MPAIEPTDENALLTLTEAVERAVFSVCQFDQHGPTGTGDIVKRLAPVLDQDELQCLSRPNDIERELKSQFAKVAEWHKKLLRRTYSVASFWSPSDKQRRSLYHGPLKDDRQKAWASLFFLLTRQGVKATPPLYSATQYLAERATRKQSPPIVFDDNIPLSLEAWHIRKEVRDWLFKALEINIIVTEHESVLASILPGMLLGQEVEKAELLDLADQVLEAVNQLGLNEDLKSYYGPMPSRIKAWFHQPEDNNTAVDIRTVLFMELTYAIWYEANPETAIAYTFPSSVEATVCVLTVGAAEPISPFQQSLLLWFSKTLFFHPLASEYQDLATRNALSDFGTRILNHNLKNHFLLPLGTHLRNAQRFLRESENESIDSELKSARVILRHYDALAGCSVITLDESRFVHPLPIILLSDVQYEFTDLFNTYLKEQFYLNGEESSILKLKWKPAQPGFRISSDLGWLLENLANLVSNSVRYGNMKTPGKIRIECASEDDGIKISFRDSGNGCTTPLLHELRTRVDSILKASEHGLLAVLAALGPHQKGGIGLRSCALHLRAAWRGPCAERMSINSSASGFQVIMRFPHVTSD